MSSDCKILKDDEIKLAQYIRDSLRISENITKDLKTCIIKRSNGMCENFNNIDKITSSLKDTKYFTKKLFKAPIHSRYSIKGSRSISKKSKSKKVKTKGSTLNDQELKRAKIRKELPAAIQGDLKVETTCDIEKPSIKNMKCNSKSRTNRNDFCSKDILKHIEMKNKEKNVVESNLLNSNKRKKSLKNKVEKVSERNAGSIEIYNNKRKNELKNTPHVFDPLNSTDTYPIIARSLVTSHSSTTVTSVIPYNHKKDKSKDKENSGKERSYQEVPGTHVGFLIKTFKKNSKCKKDESVFDMVFDLSINLGKNKSMIPLNIIANFSSDRNPIVATNGILFEQE
uniref:INCENP_ARK-bind domain-containing protein n=1 Tax=Strongyloides papillosus TaxID=174720 RepID=A0A0N5C3A8_STREA